MPWNKWKDKVKASYRRSLVHVSWGCSLNTFSSMCTEICDVIPPMMRSPAWKYLWRIGRGLPRLHFALCNLKAEWDISSKSCDVAIKTGNLHSGQKYICLHIIFRIPKRTWVLFWLPFILHFCCSGASSININIFQRDQTNSILLSLGLNYTTAIYTLLQTLGRLSFPSGCRTLTYCNTSKITVIFCKYRAESKSAL